MARAKRPSPPPAQAEKPAPKRRVVQDVKLPDIRHETFRLWIVGHTPLIVHAWSQKAKEAMLGKQQKEVSEGLAIRDPEADFEASLYAMSPETDAKGNKIPLSQRTFGFPVTAVKKAMLSVAHKDRGVPRATVMGALTLHHEMIRVMPALRGAACDMPLVRIYGGVPEMREDMVRVGSGLNKKATLAYRAQFNPWALRIRGRVNVSACPFEWVPFLARHSGLAVGIGDWRNEKNGIFGAYHIANPQEMQEWEAYYRGSGPLPAPVTHGDGFGFDDDDEFEEAAQ
jgi:hypothetical protein